MLPRLLKTLPLLWLLVLVLAAVPLSVPMPAAFAAGIAGGMHPPAVQTAADPPPCHGSAADAASVLQDAGAPDESLCCVAVFHFCCSPVTAISTALTACEPAPGREAPPPDVPAASAQTVPSGIFRPPLV